MNPQQFELLNRLVLQPLKDQGAEVFIFGSRAVGTHHPHSDVDILFRPSPQRNLPPGLISSLKEFIEDSKFPFAVDLVRDEDLSDHYRPLVESQLKPL